MQKETKGRVTLDINGAGVLGSAGECYDLAAKGVVDIAVFGPALTPGRFLATSVGDLPIWCDSMEIGTKAFRELQKKGYFDNDYKDTMLIGLFSNMPYNFGWVKQPVAKLEDFKGKKIRAPGGLYPKMCSALGATAVSLPVGDTYPALEKGIVDGTFVNGPMLWDYKYPEILRFLTGPRVSYWMMGIAFNKQSYAKLPKDVQKIIDDNRLTMVDKAIDSMKQSATNGYNLFDKSGGKTDTLSAGDVKKIKELFSPIFRDWIKGMEARGLPGQKIIDDLYSAFEKLGVKEPFIVAPN